MNKKQHEPYWLPVEDALDKIKKAESSPKKILILGAGIAGLAAAYELAKLGKGHTVHILEASERIGGRIWTHRFGPKPKKGQKDTRPYHELGAMRIPECTHDYTWHYIKEMGLKTREFFNQNESHPGFLDIKGKLIIDQKPYKDLIELYPDLKEKEKQIVQEKGPEKLLDYFLNPLLQHLKEEHLVAKLVNGILEDPYLRWMDSHSVRTFLLELVEKKEMSQDALKLIGAVLSLESLWSWSLAEFIRGTFTNSPPEGGKLFEIIGGTDFLPKALYAKIQEFDSVTIELHTEVTGLKVISNDELIVCTKNLKSGKERELKDYDRVLCTIPFPVMRLMNLKGLSPKKMEAIRKMEYTSSTKVLLLCSDRFWEKQENPIFGGRSVSDRLSRQTYYPCDFKGNEPLDPECDTESLRNNTEGSSFWTVHGHRSASKKISPDKLDSEEKSPAVLLGSYSWTDNSRQIGRLERSKEAPALAFETELSGRAKQVIEDLDNIHKGIEAFVTQSASIYWDTYPWSRGAFGATPPGDLSYYYQDGRKSAGRLFFAGEHISIAPGWIQGALESSLAAVYEILSQKLKY